MKTTQKECRELIKYGNAVDLNKLPTEELYDIAHHLKTLAIGHGVYGMNCGIFQDIRDGKMYACPSRSNALFIVY